MLATLAEGQNRSAAEIVGLVSDQFGLTADERAELIPSGRQRLMYNKTQWAISHMFAAGLVSRPSRGHMHITSRGTDALKANADRIDMKVLQQYESYRLFRAKKNGKVPGHAPALVEDDDMGVSPEELLALARAENETAMETELLTRALALDPAGFERLVLAVLRVMRYGSAGSIEYTGKTGDGGIDGVISQDPLGPARIYLQAKRYAPGHTVQRLELQQFVAASMRERVRVNEGEQT